MAKQHIEIQNGAGGDRNPYRTDPPRAVKRLRVAVTFQDWSRQTVAASRHIQEQERGKPVEVEIYEDELDDLKARIEDRDHVVQRAKENHRLNQRDFIAKDLGIPFERVPEDPSDWTVDMARSERGYPGSWQAEFASLERHRPGLKPLKRVEVLEKDIPPPTTAAQSIEMQAQAQLASMISQSIVQGLIEAGAVTIAKPSPRGGSKKD